MNRQAIQALKKITNQPYEVGRKLGFTRLTTLNNEWIKEFIFGTEDYTLQAHRESYKTTCVSLALALIILIYPNDRTAFIRKTDSDVKEIMRQVAKMLQSEFMNSLSEIIWGTKIQLLANNSSQITTNLSNDPRGTAQLTGLGIGTSITGKHFDRIFTDDIVNREDRISKAAREETKLLYQELVNVAGRAGRIVNTGTPWHEEDAFVLMPNIHKYDCYTTGLMSEEDIAKKKTQMLPSLFAANYELRHIASEDVIFENPQTGADPELAKQGIYHVDCAYDGEDYTALTIANRHDGKIYVYGKCWRRNCVELEDTIIALADAFNSGKMYNEKNADKGFFARDMRAKGARVTLYNENMNKYVKITSYLKAAWENVIFVQGTDDEYIKQITDYYEDAEHDDCPDSLASVARVYYKKSDDKYEPLWVM